jgi:pimeloyl-ACP methyl ester carboxylesterase
LKAFLWGGSAAFLLLILTVHVVAWLIGRHEQPERLGAPIYSGELNGFGILWVDKRAANPAGTIVFIHGTPGRAGVWREQFANPFPGVDLVAPELEKLRWFQFAANTPLVECLMPRSLRQCNREILAAPGDLNDLRNQLSNLSVPIVMLHGTRDRLVPVENVAWLESRLVALGKTNLFAKIELPGANHFIPWERPADVAEGIRTLVQMVEPGGARVGR